MAYFETSNPIEIKIIDYNDMSNYKTPAQIIRDNNLEWRAQQIGVLYSLKLVSGFPTGRTTLVNENDVLELYKLRK